MIDLAATRSPSDRVGKLAPRRQGPHALALHVWRDPHAASPAHWLDAVQKHAPVMGLQAGPGLQVFTQSLQVPPETPQALFAVPTRHRPLVAEEQQPPLHDVAPETLQLT